METTNTWKLNLSLKVQILTGKVDSKFNLNISECLNLFGNLFEENFPLNNFAVFVKAINYSDQGLDQGQPFK